jgi:flagellar biosynthesis regulator FlbT
MSEKTGNGEKFTTPAGRKWINIYEVNKEKGIIIFRRSTGKTTENFENDLQIYKLKDIHDMIHEGKIANDAKEIAKIYPIWKTYISALLRHLGCVGSRP